MDWQDWSNWGRKTILHRSFEQRVQSIFLFRFWANPPFLSSLLLLWRIKSTISCMLLKKVWYFKFLGWGGNTPPPPRPSLPVWRGTGGIISLLPLLPPPRCTWLETYICWYWQRMVLWDSTCSTVPTPQLFRFTFGMDRISGLFMPGNQPSDRCPDSRVFLCPVTSRLPDVCQISGI